MMPARGGIDGLL